MWKMTLNLKEFIIQENDSYKILLTLNISIYISIKDIQIP